MKEAGNTNSPKLAFDFIDPLFAVAVHISLVEGLGKTEWYERWHESSATWPTLNATDGFNLGALLLGYFIVVTSWFGYHQSVAKSQIRLNTTPGMLRFAVDVLLLVLYCGMLALFENFAFVLWAIVVTFLLFVVWDQLKRLEYPKEDYGDTARRRGVTIVWAVAYVALAILGTWFWRRSPSVLIVALVFSILYRWHKTKPCVPLPRVLCWPYSDRPSEEARP
jgi:hypothetical protein